MTIIPSPSTSPFDLHWSLHPKVYIAPNVSSYTSRPSSFQINGNLNKEPWTFIPFSSPFNDIRGNDDAPPNERPQAYDCSTRMKMMWDDNYLYIGALIESNNNTLLPVTATFTQRNSPIFHHDSDFEVFVDPFNSCHDYKELEMNALNTVWNLMLNKPYMDGGEEYSGRIAKFGDDKFYDVTSQRTAVKILQGEVNNADCEKTIWSVEIALSHQDTLVRSFDTIPNDPIMVNVPPSHPSSSSQSLYPTYGNLWRINFSRVEKKGLLNWTWQKQVIWDPNQLQYRGKVDMHLPDAWGYVHFGPPLEEASSLSTDPNSRIVMGASSLSSDFKLFSNSIGECEDWKQKGDPLWPAKLVAMHIYYAQKRYFEVNNQYASKLDNLNEYSNKDILGPFMDNDRIELELYSSSDKKDSLNDQYVVRVHDFSGITVHLNNERLMSSTGSIRHESFTIPKGDYS